ncbi:MAG: acetate--CoA ligase family protein [Thermoplasmata archaeon]|nr:acetate--CoA ligase family protein [Thermoplasmata archaeon]
MDTITQMEKMFAPRSVAIIGASDRDGSIGHSLVKNLVNGGFEGDVFPINPRYPEVFGKKCYGSIKDIPIVPDLTLLAVPAEVSNATIKEACEHGCRMFINIASGFAEVGRRDLEWDMKETLAEYGARMLGPNVFGVYSAKASMNATFGPSVVKPGNVGLISQSGALGVALMGKTVTEGIGLSAVVSIGNKADISECEALEYLGHDDITEVIFLYLEGAKDGRRLMDIAKKVSKKKPIIAIKSGSSEKGALAAASHTGSLAGSDKIFTAALEQAGVLRALNLEDGFGWLRAMADLPIPEAEGMVIVTNGGGIGVISSDSAERYRVRMLDDTEMLEELFRPTMPSYGSTKNPIDITGQGQNKEYEMALDIALEDDRIPAIVGLYCQTATGDPTEIAEAAISSIKKSKKKKPIVFSMVGGKGIAESIAELNLAGIPSYASPDGAMSAMGALYKRYRRLKVEDEEPEDFQMDLEKIKSIIKNTWDKGMSNLTEDDCNLILKEAGLTFPSSAVAKNLEEAKKVANEIGYPVVMKILSPDILHKTEFGGVRLDLEDDEELEIAYESIMATVRNRFDKARINGVMITSMIKDATEMILGFSQDPSFGPVIMFGMGGIYVEILQDVAFRVAPISRKEIMGMIREISSYPILAGARGKNLRDIEALADAISRISYLSNHVPEIVELDINPLMAMDQGKGCLVVDSRMTIRGEVK